jgi:hypothetical protein
MSKLCLRCIEKTLKKVYRDNPRRKIVENAPWEPRRWLKRWVRAERKIVKDFNVFRTSLETIVINHLKLKPYKKQKKTGSCKNPKMQTAPYSARWWWHHLFQRETIFVARKRPTKRPDLFCFVDGSSTRKLAVERYQCVSSILIWGVIWSR